ncbi:MAG: hypothetical protein HQ515_20395 [Phycisphaeraceae bacterium]|nr:hypothetical protein [Phycisphaeraceae bacterium]
MTKTGTESKSQAEGLVRRDFLKHTGAGIISSVALVSALSSKHTGQTALAEGSRGRPVDRIASNSYAVNRLFKRSGRSTRRRL